MSRLACVPIPRRSLARTAASSLERIGELSCRIITSLQGARQGHERRPVPNRHRSFSSFERNLNRLQVLDQSLFGFDRRIRPQMLELYQTLIPVPVDRSKEVFEIDFAG